VRTGVAADAGEAVLRHAACEDFVGHLPNDGTPRAILVGKALVVDRLQSVQVIRHQPKELRRLRASGFVDATRRRRRDGQFRRTIHEAPA